MYSRIRPVPSAMRGRENLYYSQRRNSQGFNSNNQYSSTEASPMERCKRDGESMNNGGVLNADRISELPEALILQILSLLPTGEAIATSVLSKQWQSLWKMLPNLKLNNFKDRSCDLETFSKHVCKALLSHKALVLQSLQLHLNICFDRSNYAMGARMLIRTALFRNVRNLELQISSEIWLRFPKSFYNCETLETLNLRFIGLLEVPSSVCLKSLRTLHLYYVDFEDEESVHKLLSGCPNLESLEVQKHPSSSIVTFTIAVPSLERLTLSDYSHKLCSGYVINAPSLKYLKIGLSYTGFCLTENVTKLVEAKLSRSCLIEHVLVEPDRADIFGIILNKKLLGSLASVKRLSLKVSPETTELFLTSSKNIFHQLVYLELHTHEGAWRILLSLMLEGSPNLQVLKLIDTLGMREEPPMCLRWNQPKHVPECLMYQLETFMWKGYVWKREDHTEAAKYILSNAHSLKSAAFLSQPMDLKERDEMVEDLSSAVRASNSCELLFELLRYTYIYD